MRGTYHYSQIEGTQMVDAPMKTYVGSGKKPKPKPKPKPQKPRPGY